MDEPVTIRVVTHSDIVAVQGVAGVTWRATYAGQISDIDIAQFLDSAYGDRSLTTKVDRLGDGFIVAESGGSVIGYAMAGLNRDSEPELYALYVLPEHQGRGAGRQLWDAALAGLARRGHRRMCCWVLATNGRACRFYEQRGAILTDSRTFAIGATMVREARYCVSSGIRPDYARAGSSRRF